MVKTTDDLLRILHIIQLAGDGQWALPLLAITDAAT